MKSNDYTGERMLDAAQDKLIQAAILMIEAKGPDGFSVREVAAAAQVNHGLVHRHFGSKAQLVEAAYEAVVTKISKYSAEGNPEEDGFSPSEMFALVGQLKPHLNCLLWIIKSGYRPKALDSIFPFLSTSTVGDERKTFAAVISSAVLGWHLYKPLVAGALNADALDLEPKFGQMLDQLQSEFWIKNL